MPKVALADNYTTTARQPQQQQKPLTQQTKTEPTPPEDHLTIPPPQQPPPTISLTIIHKNARSLCKDESVDELLAELAHTAWAHTNELWTTEQGKHVFAGSGNDEPNHGRPS